MNATATGWSSVEDELDTQNPELLELLEGNRITLLLSEEGRPVGIIFTPSDAVLIVRAVNERPRLQQAMKACALALSNAIAQVSALALQASWIEGEVYREALPAIDLARAVRSESEVRS